MARKWSIARLWAIRKSQAENGAELPAEPADRLEHLEERLRRQVLGVVPVADAHVQVAVDAVEVEEVELLERVSIALLGALDEADVDAVGRLCCCVSSSLSRGCPGGPGG